MLKAFKATSVGPDDSPGEAEGKREQRATVWLAFAKEIEADLDHHGPVGFMGRPATTLVDDSEAWRCITKPTEREDREIAKDLIRWQRDCMHQEIALESRLLNVLVSIAGASEIDEPEVDALVERLRAFLLERHGLEVELPVLDPHGVAVRASRAASPLPEWLRGWYSPRGAFGGAA